MRGLIGRNYDYQWVWIKTGSYAGLLTARGRLLLDETRPDDRIRRCRASPSDRRAGDETNLPEYRRFTQQISKD